MLNPFEHCMKPIWLHTMFNFECCTKQWYTNPASYNVDQWWNPTLCKPSFIQHWLLMLYEADSYNVDQHCMNPDSYYGCFQHCTNPASYNVSFQRCMKQIHIMLINIVQTRLILWMFLMLYEPSFIQHWLSMLYKAMVYDANVVRFKL